MNNEQQQIIDEAYENFVNWVLSEENQNNKNEIVKIPSSKEIFIKRIKGDNEIIKKMGKLYCDKFSERWGLKIEERELSLEEREKIAITKYPQLNETPHGALIDSRPFSNEFGDSLNIPTKLITITYNDKIIESYE
jgi:hypothetical protein